MALFSNSWDSLRAWWMGATATTRAMATGMVLFMVVGLIIAASLAASPDFEPIYHGVSGKDAAAMETVLREHGITMRYDDKEQTVSVPAKDGSNATMYISAAGILSQDSVAVDTDPQVPISPMDSPEVIAQKQNTAKENAMDRKLMRLDPIQSAAVSISPGSSSSLFGSDTLPTASVILTLKSGETLNGLQVKGIVNLIAHAVTGLTPQNVTLTDQSGAPLWKDNGAGGNGSEGAPTAENDKFSESERQKVQALLDSSLGHGKAIITVNAELDQDVTSKDLTEFSAPEGSPNGLPVSSKTDEENYSGGGAGPAGAAAGGVAGAGGNLNVPSYQTTGAANGSGKYSKTNTLQNYDHNKAIIHTQVAPGTVKKETVAALIDTSVPAENIPKIKDIIATSIGAAPSDTTRFVTVQQIAFDTSAQKAAAGQMQAIASQQLIGTIVRAVAVAAVAIVLLFLLTRSSRRPEQPQLALAGGGANIGLLEENDERDEEISALLNQVGAHSTSITHRVDDRPLTVEDVLSEMPEPESNSRRRSRGPAIEAQQDAKMDSIRTMIAAHPENVALLLKGWMSEDSKVLS